MRRQVSASAVAPASLATSALASSTWACSAVQEVGAARVSASSASSLAGACWLRRVSILARVARHRAWTSKSPAPASAWASSVTCSASSRRPWAWTASARFGSSLRRNQSCSLTARSASHPCLSSSHRRCGPSRPGGFLGSEHAPPQRPRAWGNSTYFTQAAGPSGGARWRSGPRLRTPPVLIIGLGPTAGDRDPGPGLRWPDELGRCRGSAAGQRSGPSGTAELLCALSYGSGLAVAERMAHGTNTAFAGCRQRSRRTSRSSRHGGGDCRAGWWMKVRRVVSR